MMRSAGIAVLVAAAAGAAEPPGDAARVGELIERWVEVEDTISTERADWEAEKTTMADLLRLYREEIGLLDEELAEAGMSAGGHDERMTGARSGVERMRGVRAKAARLLAREVPRLRRLAEWFPAPLRAEAREDLAALDAWREGGEPRDGVRAVLGVVAKAEAFHRRLTRTEEVRGGREVEVLYLGLARAYFVGGGTAGVGVPGPGGWKWRERPGLAGQLGHALEVLDMKRPPEVAELPVAVGAGPGRGEAR